MRTVLALLLLTLSVPAQAAKPEDPGLYTSTSEVDTLQAGPAQVKATVCIPDAPGPRPVVAIATSSLESREVLAGLCLHLATHGFIVAVPDLGFVNTDGESIAHTLLDTLAFFTRENARAGSRFEGRVDPLHRGVMGYGTGGMGALIAAARDETLSAAVLLDPQDVNGQARAAAAQITRVPVLMVRADPGLCNGQDSFGSVYDALSGPRSTLHIVFSGGCDPESPASQQCTALCGGYHPVSAKWFSRYATADVGYFVGCEDALRTYVDGAQLQDQAGDHTIDHLDLAALPPACGPYVLADAGAPDAGPGESTGCGCTTGAPLPASAWLLLGLAALGFAGRSLRASKR